MALRIELQDGRAFLIDTTLSQWEQVFQLAATTNAVIEVELPDGRIIPVDPRSIQSFQEEPEAQEALAQQFPEAAPA